MGHNSSEYLHTLIEALKLSFIDAEAFIADQNKTHVPVSEMLSCQYADTRRKLITHR